MSIAYQNLNSIEIDNVNVNKKGIDLHNITRLSQLQALQIFSHVSDNTTRLQYENELLLQLPLFNGTDLLPDIAINHTNGVADNVVGISPMIVSSLASGTHFDTPSQRYVLDLTPGFSNWRSLTVVGSAKNMTVNTNMVADDASDNFVSNSIKVTRYLAYMSAWNGSTLNTLETIYLNKNTAPGSDVFTICGTGILNAPPLIGDLGTFYAEVLNTQTPPNDQLGLGGTYSNYYYIYAIAIPASAKTKNYKFRISLIYI